MNILPHQIRIFEYLSTRNPLLIWKNISPCSLIHSCLENTFVNVKKKLVKFLPLDFHLRIFSLVKTDELQWHFFFRSIPPIMSKCQFEGCTSSYKELFTLKEVFLTLFHAGRGIYAPPTTFRQFSTDVLIQGGSSYTLNLSFAIT